MISSLRDACATESAILFEYNPQLPGTHIILTRSKGWGINKRNAPKTAEFEEAVSKAKNKLKASDLLRAVNDKIHTVTYSNIGRPVFLENVTQNELSI